ncbi:MAG: alanine--tRNA ligase [Candidatus Diapherotrites archaeon]
MGVSKQDLREKFAKDWKKHYNVEFLVKKGFRRKKCEKCGRNFWTLDEKRKTCADSSCSGFGFIGKPGKKLGYIETWRAIEKYFVKRGHKSIPRYPVVARWRDDLYFTNASIIDFQPYVVSGEIEPPANPLIVPQASLRFNDLENVGVTGQHYSSFIMFGQHAFNSKKTGLFYWKDEALTNDFNYLTKIIGVKEEDLCFQEDVWAGGGTFGPCIEYCAQGVELGNCVFMQYKDLGNGKSAELKTKVIDMGAGLERLAWYTNGTPTSYEVVFDKVLKGMFKNAGLSYDKKLFTEYARLSGGLDIEGLEIAEKKKAILKKLGLSETDFAKKIRPVQALYACADHLKTILYTTSDGMLPSNSGGGYNLRMVLRRVFALDREFGLNLRYDEILRDHAESLKGFESLEKAVFPAGEVVVEERKKESEARANASKKIAALLESAGKGKGISESELVRLYESDGVPVELVEEEALKKGVQIKIPENFYQLIVKKNEVEITEQPKMAGLEKYDKTRELFYLEEEIEEFDARVLGIEEDAIILDRTLFYPGTGGQASDSGTLNGMEVEDVEKHEGVIFHYVKNPDAFREGSKVVGKINLKRRKQLARHHTATHLLNAAARNLLGAHVWQAGARKDIDKAHLDITHYRRLIPEQLRQLEHIVNESIRQNITVTSTEMPRSEAEKKYGFILYQGGYVPGKTLRVVNVLGLDVEACGGTHVKSTGEIGFFKILKREGVQDGVERIIFACGEPALKEVHRKEKLLEDSAKIFSVQEQELARTSERFFNEWKDLRKALEGAQKDTAKSKAAELGSAEGKELKAYFEGMDSKTLIETGNGIIAKKQDAMAVLGSGETLLVVCGPQSGKNAGEELKKLLAQFGGRGGGSERMAVGRIEKAAELKEFLERR